MLRQDESGLLIPLSAEDIIECTPLALIIKRPGDNLARVDLGEVKGEDVKRAVEELRDRDVPFSPFMDTQKVQRFWEKVKGYYKYKPLGDSMVYSDYEYSSEFLEGMRGLIAGRHIEEFYNELTRRMNAALGTFDRTLGLLEFCHGRDQDKLFNRLAGLFNDPKFKDVLKDASIEFMDHPDPKFAGEVFGGERRDAAYWRLIHGLDIRLTNNEKTLMERGNSSLQWLADQMMLINLYLLKEKRA